MAPSAGWRFSSTIFRATNPLPEPVHLSAMLIRTGLREDSSPVRDHPRSRLTLSARRILEIITPRQFPVGFHLFFAACLIPTQLDSKQLRHAGGNLP